MHCVFIANCELRALPRTRALLDRYAQRIGDRAWATRITQAALDEVHIALRRKATRQTSVACYRSDSILGLRLVWIVGNQDSYDGSGRFAIATQCHKKEFPMPFRHAALIATLAGYAHDLGKASKAFQNKLNESTETGTIKKHRDSIRHEWLSAWLLRSMLTQRDTPISPDLLHITWAQMAKKEGKDDGADKYTHPPDWHLRSPLDTAIFAVCTHHGAMGGALGEGGGPNGSKHIQPRPEGNLPNHLFLQLATTVPAGADEAARWHKVLQGIEHTRKRLMGIDRPEAYWEGVMLLARAALIFADHKVSSRKFDGTRDGVALFANTKKENSSKTEIEKKPSLRRRTPRIKQKPPQPLRFLDQPLSWHLLRVGEEAAQNVRMFTGDGLPTVDPDLVAHTLSTRSSEGSAFSWQDGAADAIANTTGGKLVLNVASTGAGKTLANLKMAFAMHPRTTRLAVAFNLRSLTQQTFKAFRDHLAMGDAQTFDRDFACLLGDYGAIERDFSKEDEDDIDSVEPLDLEGAKDLVLPSWLTRIAPNAADTNDNLAKLIASPVLVSTMDWIVAAGEPGQQARHAKALIRVATSDLILDEVDSYDVGATVAVMRVVQTAASFGRNVIVSSATLSPALTLGLVAAYTAGRTVQDALFGSTPWSLIMCSDSFAPAVLVKPDPQAAFEFYRRTMRAMCQTVARRTVTKRFVIAPTENQEPAEPTSSGMGTFCKTIVDAATNLHEKHATRPANLSCRLSIGLVRVANVSTCREVSEFLRQDGRFYVTAYHAREILERRAHKERWLDRILSRNDNKWIGALIEAEPNINGAIGDIRLIVVATPVEEVGRDHDFDWAIIEPSSMHSIIQTAGRVNRHRRTEIVKGKENVVLLSCNARSLKYSKNDSSCPGVFVRPGLEIRDNAAGIRTHKSYDLQELMMNEAGEVSDILDAGLVFDEGGQKTRFAEYDEAAIAKHTEEALPIIERRQGYETHFMLCKFAEKFPLRDRKRQQRLLIDLDQQKFQYEPSNTWHGEVKLDRDVSRTWLTILPGQLSQKLASPIAHYSTSQYDSSQPIENLVVCWNGVFWDSDR